jgi:hypothetical protein
MGIGTRSFFSTLTNANFLNLKEVTQETNGLICF